MIGERELERRAASLGISIQHAELDYVLCHLLARLAAAPNGLVLRGGTALTRVYWPDFRISEDLDLLWPIPQPDLATMLGRLVARAADATAIDLEVVHGRWRDDQIRSVVHWTTPWGTGGDLLIDVVRHQRVILPAVVGSLRLPYSDLAEADGRIPVVDLLEILANKWLMLDEREEPRDLFDLWWAFEHEQVGFGAIANAHRRVYGFPIQPASIERAARLESRWQERLSQQMRALPSFNSVLATVRDRYEAWRASADLGSE